MTTAHDIAQQAIAKAKSAQYFIVRLRCDEFYGMGPLPFDIKIKDSVVTAKVLAVSIEDAKRQVEAYFLSDDWLD